ncbi:MAG: hypothetical protein KDA99_12665, partial [Planctomycetales bacterium]|nr:hypothetical protein [Planctomycetales bacterium]
MRKTESTRRVRWHHSRIVGTSRLAIAASTLLLLTSVVQAAPEIVIGVHDLLPDTANQIVTLNLITADQPVRGMNVRAELGDGLGPGIEPIFSGATYTSTVWDAFPTTTLGGPVEGAEQFLQSSVNFSDTGLSVLPNGPV